MNFDVFTEIIFDNVRDYLPEEYRDVEITLEEISKLNETYQALTVKKEGCGFVPRINLDSLYEQFCIDTLVLLRDVAKEVAGSIIRDLSREDVVPMECFLDYERATELLFIRVSPEETNRELLKTLPNRVIHGLAMTCHLYFGTSDGSFRSSMVTEALREQFGVTGEQLLKDSLANSRKILPPVLKNLREDPELKKIPVDREPALYMLTNRTGINGAAVLFYPGMMEEMAQQLEDSYFVLPSSIHEMMLIPEGEAPSTDKMEGLLWEANQKCVAPAEKLSDDVFHYDMKSRRFETVRDWKKRKGDYVN